MQWRTGDWLPTASLAKFIQDKSPSFSALYEAADYLATLLEIRNKHLFNELELHQSYNSHLTGWINQSQDLQLKNWVISELLSSLKTTENIIVCLTRRQDELCCFIGDMISALLREWVPIPGVDEGRAWNCRRYFGRVWGNRDPLGLNSVATSTASDADVNDRVSHKLLSG